MFQNQRRCNGRLFFKKLLVICSNYGLRLATIFGLFRHLATFGVIAYIATVFTPVVSTTGKSCVAKLADIWHAGEHLEISYHIVVFVMEI